MLDEIKEIKQQIVKANKKETPMAIFFLQKY